MDKMSAFANYLRSKGKKVETITTPTSSYMRNLISEFGRDIEEIMIVYKETI